MLIRRLIPTDAEHYRALMLGAYADHPDAFSTTRAERESRPLSWWQARISADARTRVYGAFDARNTLCGVIGLSRKTQPKTQHKATLFGLYVLTEARKQGVAGRLIGYLLNEARTIRTMKTIQLSVTQSNIAAISLYQRCGFEQFGLEPMATAFADGYLSKLHMCHMLE